MLQWIEREIDSLGRQPQPFAAAKEQPQLPDGWRIVWTCVFPGGWHSVGLQHSDYDDDDERRVKTGDGVNYREAIQAAIKATRGDRLWRWLFGGARSSSGK